MLNVLEAVCVGIEYVLAAVSLRGSLCWYVLAAVSLRAQQLCWYVHQLCWYVQQLCWYWLAAVFLRAQQLCVVS
jgi:hypothetical protein